MKETLKEYLKILKEIDDVGVEVKALLDKEKTLREKAKSLAQALRELEQDEIN